jgi:1,4-alpha-glucan branching enzyme
MGAEIGQTWEWRDREEMPWQQLQQAPHLGVQRLTADLNRFYLDEPALYDQDFSVDGFRWIDCHDADHSVVSWIRQARDGRHVVVVLNFTPVPREGYRLGVPHTGNYVERINTDSAHYGGSDLGNGGLVPTENRSWMGLPASVVLTLPPLAALVLMPA